MFGRKNGSGAAVRVSETHPKGVRKCRRQCVARRVLFANSPEGGVGSGIGTESPLHLRPMILLNSLLIILVMRLRPLFLDSLLLTISRLSIALTSRRRLPDTEVCLRSFCFDRLHVRGQRRKRHAGVLPPDSPSQSEFSRCHVTKLRGSLAARKGTRVTRGRGISVFAGVCGCAISRDIWRAWIPRTRLVQLLVTGE